MSDLLGDVMSEARILERPGQPHEHIPEPSQCENSGVEVGVPEVASSPDDKVSDSRWERGCRLQQELPNNPRRRN